MNIFVSDFDPIISAQNLDDKRVKHMPRESFEMISMAYYKNTGICIAPFIIWNKEQRRTPDKFRELYNHKCTNWVASKRENMAWLWNHAIAMLDETRYRFNKDHWLRNDFLEISHLIPVTNYPPKSFVNATPYQEDSVIESYRMALNTKWYETDEVRPVLWTKRGKPTWAKEIISYHQGNLFYNYDESFDDLPF